MTLPQELELHKQHCYFLSSNPVAYIPQGIKTILQALTHLVRLENDKPHKAHIQLELTAAFKRF